MKAKVKKVIVENWYVVLPDGDTVSLSSNDVKKFKLKEGQDIEGEIETIQEQIRSTDGSYSRSYTEYKEFKIKNI